MLNLCQGFKFLRNIEKLFNYLQFFNASFYFFSNKMLLLLTILNNKSSKVLDKPLYYLAITIIFQTHSYPILKSPISKTIHIVQNKRIKRKNVGKLQQNVLTLSYCLLKIVPFSSILLIHLITYVLMLVWWFSSITSIMLDMSAFCYS